MSVAILVTLASLLMVFVLAFSVWVIASEKDCPPF